MTFYAIPPNGFMHMEKMISLGRKRLQFFEVMQDLVNESKPFENEEKDSFFSNVDIEKLHDRLSELHYLSESVMEETPHDKTAFCLLQLVVAYSDNFELSEFIIRGEQNLFKYRLQISEGHITQEVLLRLIQDLDLLYEKDKSMLTITSVLKGICQPYTSIPIPFQYLTKLVARREIKVRDGNALITKDVEKEFLLSVFQFLYQRGIKNLRNSNNDEFRLPYMMNNLIRFFLQEICPKLYRHNLASSDNIQTLSVHFPLCFHQLYLILMNENRLRHDSRIAFTLFLKEIGVSLNGSISFWSMNYSKESKSSGCNHSWQKDQRKLLYSIRHSYGLEGNKINYSAHSCSSIQKNSYKGPNEQLICPFTNQGNGFAHPDIEDLVQSRQPSKACERYFAHLKQSHVQTTLLKPSDYFFSSFNIEKES